jgi:hypothetical protein
MTKTTKPYFTIPELPWSGTWSAGNKTYIKLQPKSKPKKKKTTKNPINKD